MQQCMSCVSILPGCYYKTLSLYQYQQNLNTFLVNLFIYFDHFLLLKQNFRTFFYFFLGQNLYDSSVLLSGCYSKTLTLYQSED